MQTQTTKPQSGSQPQAERTQQNVTKRPLSEHGASLPIGVLDGAGKLAKSMAHRVWNLRQEKALGKLRDKHKNMTVARFAATTVAVLYEKLGAHSFSDDPSKAASAVANVGSMFMGDVLYAYVWLRNEVCGPEVLTDLTCPRCGEASRFAGDLNSLDVRSVERLSDASWTYHLHDPFVVRGEPVKGFVMGPARWFAIEAAMASGGGLSTGHAKAALIHGSIEGVLGRDQVVLAEHELDELSKRDLEILTGLIDENHLGPDMAIDSVCPSCEKSFRVPIDWGYDSFFGLSGRSAR